MPSTAVGLLFFVVLLAPGLTYSGYRAASLPVEKPSALRELAGIVMRSVVWDAVALGLFGLFRLWQPHHTPDVGALARHPGVYARNHPAYLVWWIVAVLAVACVLGLVGARVASLDRFPDLLKPKGGVSADSAWWTLFHQNPGNKIYVGVVLEDDTYLAGALLSYSPDSDETADRELTLVGPIKFRPSGGESEVDLDVGAVAVSARRIRYMTVSYLSADDGGLSEPPATDDATLREPSAST